MSMECHSEWNLTQIGMSLKMEYHSNYNVTQKGMSLVVFSFLYICFLFPVYFGFLYISISCIFLFPVYFCIKCTKGEAGGKLGREDHNE